ncbi:LANO_0F14906g1_1 [Lachancea nothofagi CBS 11611]|uniref:LANO_0F14906g1_1 n=1 Tax=Lachancea nothofagi CBS 11611 TaxID=1266666 RepID=A0A1G4KCJ9_9SACH|nr:LANO_0F14906g1_1 [Lachancea nothofagi CBS 11611]
MYRGSNRAKSGQGENSEVRGPNSALTQFLKEQGINAESIRQKWLKSREKETKEVSTDVKEEEEDEDVSSSKYFTKGRRRAISDSSEENDEDDEDDDEEEDNNNADGNSLQTRRSVPRSDDRLKRFAIAEEDSDEEEYDEGMSSRTISETPVPAISQEQLELNLKKSKQQLMQRRRKKKRAAELLDRKIRRISTLQDVCISQISANISKLQQNTNSADDTIHSKIRETLGGISTQNMNKLARTLSKNRALNDHTLQLFLKTELRSLAFHDCSKLSYEGYKMLAIFAPHLSELSLQMCGQLNNEALLYIAEKLPNLDSLYLDGPFLINEYTWDIFFTRMGGRLKAFHVSNTHRFTNDSLRSLLEHCGNNLVSLRLSRLDDLTDYSIMPQYLKCPNFENLGLEHPAKEEYITDDILVATLKNIGSTLKHLSLNGCLAVTDTTIINLKDALSADAGTSVLESLELEELDQITSDGIVFLFSEVSMPNLKVCSFRRCLQLDDMAITEFFLNKAGKSIMTLSLNSLKALKGDCFDAMECPELKKLDIGFLGCANDVLIKKLGEQNAKLEILEVFGDNLVSGKAEIRSGLTVIGRQSDTL